MSHCLRFVAALCLLAAVFTTSAASRADDFETQREFNWHQWRGPEATGVALHGNPPIQWDESTNVKWKVEIPGEGSSTPIIWGNKLFLLTAIKTDKTVDSIPDPKDQPKRPFGIVYPNTIYQFVILCLDRETGKVLWQRVASEQVPHEGHHPDNDFASGSPITNGRRLYASFGSYGVFCYDLDGNRVWDRDLGNMETRNSFGEGGSPALHGNTLVVNWDHEGQSFIVALDATTGETRWKVDRDERTSWATPLIVPRGNRTHVITSATNRVRSYDLATGELLWECGGQTANAIPSPVTAGDLVYCTSGFRGNALYAIPIDSQGDLTDTDKIAWKRDEGTPYVPSPLLYGNQLYYLQSNNGILTSVDIETGQTVIDRTRLPNIRNVYASPVGAAGRVYLVGRDGKGLVIRHGTEFEVLAENTLEDDIDASPVVVGDELFLRGKRFLYCIANEE